MLIFSEKCAGYFKLVLKLTYRNLKMNQKLHTENSTILLNLKLNELTKQRYKQ